METDRSVDAPADSIKWVKNLYLSRAVQQKPSLLRQIVAVLRSELAAGKPAFGERSAGASQARQLLFTADEAAIDLKITGTGKKLNIAGQIIGDGFENAAILLFNDENEYSATTGELADFTIQKIDRGIYRLTVTADDLEIVIESIDLN